MQIRETVHTPWEAKELRLMCPHCSGAVYVPLPTNVTAEQRQRLISEAVGEHRSLCPSEPSSGIVYSISYPRK
jgi:hypothetical protein